jgi:hypothetical protein
MRFQTAQHGASDPQRPNESAQAFQQRRAAMMQVMRQLQMSRPDNAQTPMGGQPGGPPQAPQPPPQQGSGLMGAMGGLYSQITNALGGHQ